MGVIVQSAVLLGVCGLVIGIVLGIMGRLCYSDNVAFDEKVRLIEKELPGYNCGACGYPGCGELAKAIVLGEASIDYCQIIKALKNKQKI